MGAGRMGAQRIVVVAVLLALVASANAVYFYIEEGKPRCFVEEVPAASLVIGNYNSPDQGPGGRIDPAQHAGVKITVFGPQEVILEQMASVQGRFAFTSTLAGTHRICFGLNTTHWFGAGNKMVRIRSAACVRLTLAPEVLCRDRDRSEAGGLCRACQAGAFDLWDRAPVSSLTCLPPPLQRLTSRFADFRTRWTPSSRRSLTTGCAPHLSVSRSRTTGSRGSFQGHQREHQHAGSLVLHLPDCPALRDFCASVSEPEEVLCTEEDRLVAAVALVLQ